MANRRIVLIIFAALFLAACSFSGDQIDTTPLLTEPPNLPQATESAIVIPPVDPTSTPLPPSETPEPVQPSPTSEMVELGEPFPLLPLGYEIVLDYVELVTGDIGWGIASGADGILHILRTDNAGEEWREITPPQPLTPHSFVLTPSVHFNDPENGWVSYTGTDLIWATRDGGRTWRPSRLEFSALLGGLIHSLDEDQVWFFQFVDGGMQKVNTIVYSSQDGGITWTKLLDPFSDISIQSYDKTGVDFFNNQDGWLTRDFRGVSPNITLEITADGGLTWESLPLPSPPSGTDLYATCACGLYDPHLLSQTAGTIRLSCQCGSGENPLIKTYLYQTSDGGKSWEIEYIPVGEFHTISPGVYYVIGREIYRSDDGGVNWDKIKTVYWDGQLSFVGDQLALGIAHKTNDYEDALVKTINGCRTFSLIKPKLLPSYTVR